MDEAHAVQPQQRLQYLECEEGCGGVVVFGFDSVHKVRRVPVQDQIEQRLAVDPVHDHEKRLIAFEFPSNPRCLQQVILVE